ncbi:hypothetical protein M427DRAFT_95944, partial [Gonapodya prolifera JEL478]
LCHKNLKIDFATRLEFVFGRNGSGKSSLLAALMLALGARADQTNRGRSLKELLSYGANYGEIRLSLWNYGPDGFRHRDFGDRIIIERRIGSTGATTYKIKNANGDIVSTKRELLSQIMDHFGIDVSNPLTVLQQDVAKTFLTKSTDSDKYRFFHHGTGLQGLAKSYEQLLAGVEEIKSAVQAASEHLRDLKHEYQTWKKRWEKVEENAKLERDLDDLRKQELWAAVNIAEGEIRDFEAQIERHESRLKNAEEELRRSEVGLPFVEISLSFHLRYVVFCRKLTMMQGSVLIRLLKKCKTIRFSQICSTNCKSWTRIIKGSNE